jgi:23S rRNA (uracil1939-C5)-methyltransferase
MTKKVQVKINSMAFKGYGVARMDGKVLFIPSSATGDEAWVEIIEEKKNYSMGRLIEILRPSPWRVEPPCPYFEVCGGCQWQHIAYANHGELKKEILKEILKRLGGVKEIPSITVASSPDPYDYRTRVQLKVKGETLGYYKERSHELVEIGHCPIAHPFVNQMIPLLRKALLSFSQLNEIEINVSPEEGRGVLLLHLVKLPAHRAGLPGNDSLFHIVPLDPAYPAIGGTGHVPAKLNQGLEIFVKEFLHVHPILNGIAIMRKGKTTLLGEPHLNFTIPLNQDEGKEYLRLRTSPESFFQVNLKQNETLIQKVLEFADAKGNEMALDLYAGIGNMTLPLARVSKEIWGIEENWVAVKDARFNAERNGIENCSFIHGKVEDVLKGWKMEKPDLIVLDPPRTGCKTILDQVAGLKPKKIVYVSCEPTTLARDLRLFSNRGFALHGLALIDMFPQTYHMEVVGLLEQSQKSQIPSSKSQTNSNSKIPNNPHQFKIPGYKFKLS